MVIAFACLAASLDGRINPDGADRYVRMGSDEDIRHLMAVRDGADAIVMGGQTFRAYPKRHKSLDPEHRPIHAIVTRGRNLTSDIPPGSPLFQESPGIPVVIFTVGNPDAFIRTRYPKSVKWASLPEDNPRQAVEAITRTLEEHGCRSVLVEGGGHIVGMFLHAKALDHFHLTLCPLFLGGEYAPALFSGPGFRLEDAPRTEILSLIRHENELHLKLGLHYS